jgi:hypothetical protein
VNFKYPIMLKASKKCATTALTQQAPTSPISARTL